MTCLHTKKLCSQNSQTIRNLILYNYISKNKTFHSCLENLKSLWYKRGGLDLQPRYTASYEGFLDTASTSVLLPLLFLRKSFGFPLHSSPEINPFTHSSALLQCIQILLHLNSLKLHSFPNLINNSFPLFCEMAQDPSGVVFLIEVGQKPNSVRVQVCPCGLQDEQASTLPTLDSYFERKLKTDQDENLWQSLPSITEHTYMYFQPSLLSSQQGVKTLYYSPLESVFFFLLLKRILEP